MNDLCGGECDVHDDPRRANVNESESYDDHGDLKICYGEYDVHDDLWMNDDG